MNSKTVHDIYLEAQAMQRAGMSARKIAVHMGTLGAETGSPRSGLLASAIRSISTSSAPARLSGPTGTTGTIRATLRAPLQDGALVAEFRGSGARARGHVVKGHVARSAQPPVAHRRHRDPLCPGPAIKRPVGHGGRRPCIPETATELSSAAWIIGQRNRAHGTGTVSALLGGLLEWPHAIVEPESYRDCGHHSHNWRRYFAVAIHQKQDGERSYANICDHPGETKKRIADIWIALISPR